MVIHTLSFEGWAPIGPEPKT